MAKVQDRVEEGAVAFKGYQDGNNKRAFYTHELRLTN